MHEVLVNRLGGLSLPRKSVVRLTDRPDMTLDVYHGRKKQPQHVYIYIITTGKLFGLERKHYCLFISSPFGIYAHLVVCPCI